MLDVALLGDLQVVELGEGIAGSVAGATLALLGADVTKVVPRPVPGLGAHRPPSLMATLLDKSKRCVDAADGDEDALVAGADLVIEDMIDGVEHPESHLAAVSRRNRSAWVTISPFGLTGPQAERRGGELIAQAAGGLLATIEPVGGGRPVSPPGYVALRAVGHVGALAGLHAVDHHRGRRTPVHVEVSAQEAVALTGALPECAHVLYRCPGRAGSGRYVAPSGLFPCRDGLVRIAAIEDHQWAGMVMCLGAPAWTEGLTTRAARAEQAAMITERVADWTRDQDKAPCADQLQQAGVPSTPVNGPSELLHSPQFEHRGFLVAADVGGVTVRAPGSPWVLTPAGDTAAGCRPGRVAGLRVTELTHVLAGPLVGSLLGAMGADVLRVEEPSRLDIYRRTGPFADGVSGIERGAYFAVANHSKRSLLLDGEEGPAQVGDVIATSDVVIENVGSSRLSRLGIDRRHAAERHGSLVMSVSGFGTDGPLSQYRVYANNVQAYGGLALLTLDHDGQLAQLATVLADPLSSVLAATVVAAWALGSRRHQGMTVDLSMAEVVASTISELIAEASTGRQPAVPIGNELHPYAPHGAYPCRDGRWLALSVQSDAEWYRLVEALDFPPALAYSAWHTEGQRWQGRSKMDLALAALFQGHDVDDLAGVLIAAGLRVSPVLRAVDLVADAHLAARGFFPEVDHPDPDVGRARLVGLPWRSAGQGPVRLGSPPALGNAAVTSDGVMAPAVARGVVWAATWVPVTSPVPGLGARSDGYTVAWVDVDDGRRVQLFVDAEAPSDPGVRGTLRRSVIDGHEVDVFRPDEGAAP
jgi:crotonobetainyl-CoA:carnitine CoA-transferase CaiB-like acyl-CoA transferase